LFQFVQLLVKGGNLVNARTAFIENVMQEGVRQQVDQLLTEE
jgi:hypothetical protein